MYKNNRAAKKKKKSYGPPLNVQQEGTFQGIISALSLSVHDTMPNILQVDL